MITLLTVLLTALVIIAPHSHMSILINIEVSHLRINRRRIHLMKPGKTHQLSVDEKLVYLIVTEKLVITHNFG